MKVLVLAGLPGTGKSVIGKAIATERGYGYISTGDIARELADKSWQEQGQLAPEDYIRNRFMEEANKIKNTGVEGIVVDGMPRTVEQVYFISSLFPSIDYIFLNASRRTLIDRLSKRNREDDKMDIIQKRLDNSENSLDDIHCHILKFLPYNLRRDRVMVANTEDKNVDAIVNELLEVI